MQSKAIGLLLLLGLVMPLGACQLGGGEGGEGTEEPGGRGGEERGEGTEEPGGRGGEERGEGTEESGGRGGEEGEEEDD